VLYIYKHIRTIRASHIDYTGIWKLEEQVGSNLYFSKDARSAYCDQVLEITEISLSSMDDVRENRPTIAEIVSRLDKTETTIEKVRGPN
jgi:hypothetical protein